MEWNSALGSFIYVHLPLRPVTMSPEDLRYATCRLYSQVSSVVSRFFCLSLFKIAETIITMLIGLICEIGLPSGLLFYTLFSTLLGAAMKPCPRRTRATASCMCCFGFCFFFRGFSSEKVFARFFFMPTHQVSQVDCVCRHVQSQHQQGYLLSLNPANNDLNFNSSWEAVFFCYAFWFF